MPAIGPTSQRKRRHTTPHHWATLKQLFKLSEGRNNKDRFQAKYLQKRALNLSILMPLLRRTSRDKKCLSCGGYGKAANDFSEPQINRDRGQRRARTHYSSRGAVREAGWTGSPFDQPLRHRREGGAEAATLFSTGGLAGLAGLCLRSPGVCPLPHRDVGILLAAASRHRRSGIVAGFFRG
jgi:hypothetical protein